MKKFITVLVVLLLAVGVIATCYLVYQYFTKEKILFTEKDYPLTDASLATQPLMDAFRESFTGGEVAQKPEYSNTHPAYVRLINGEVDLIVVTEPSEEELELARKNGVELEIIPVVREGFVFFVNAGNPVENLTLEQIQKIYTGEITNWSEVGGENIPIKAFQRNVNSGSQTGMLSLVMKNLTMMEPIKENRVMNMAEIVGLVSSYDNGRNAIGYSYYYYATTMYDDIDAKIADGIKLLKVNGIEPTNKTIQNQTYPIGTAYYIVIRKTEPYNSNARKLIEAMLSTRGQELAEEVGYVPVR